MTFDWVVCERKAKVDMASPARKDGFARGGEAEGAPSRSGGPAACILYVATIDYVPHEGISACTLHNFGKSDKEEVANERSQRGLALDA